MHAIFNSFLGHILAGAMDFLFSRPWWTWVIAAALLLAFLWRWALVFYRVFGWQGLATVAVAILTLGAYRQGWLDHKAAVLSGVAKDDPIFDLSPKNRDTPVTPPPPKRRLPDLFPPLSEWGKQTKPVVKRKVQ